MGRHYSYLSEVLQQTNQAAPARLSWRCALEKNMLSGNVVSNISEMQHKCSHLASNGFLKAVNCAITVCAKRVTIEIK